MDSVVSWWQGIGGMFQSVSHAFPVDVLAVGGFEKLSLMGIYVILGGWLFLTYWILTIFWTIKDISARSNNWFVQIISVLVVAIGSPLLGLPIYLFLRPLRYKWDRIWRRDALLAQVATCPSCGEKNPLHHEYCVRCGQHTSVQCKQCAASYQWLYDYCPHCWAPNVE